MPPSVFIDGEAGTTGLRIQDHLNNRADLRLVRLPSDARRDVAARQAILNEVDVAILCLPDDAAREAVSLVKNPAVKVLDASSAHRTAPGWVYGFPELARGQRDAIRTAQRVSNPGCHASGVIASLRPLIDAGLLPASAPLSANSLSGYSGGGRDLIREYEQELGDTGGFGLYALELAHKHLSEMQVQSGLARPPLFMPGVGRFHSGLVTTVPLHLWALPGNVTGRDLHAALSAHYEGERFVRVIPFAETASLRPHKGNHYFDADALNGTNRLEIAVFANEDKREAVVAARFDNLGKGASGAAVQNLNLMLGLPEAEGLEH